MASLPALSLLFAAVVVGTSAVKIADMDQGAEFTKCLNISDWQTKTLADDITLYDRLANGCCPKGSLPGHSFYTGYQNPQIVCGFKADGSHEVIVTGSINNYNAAKCEYNKCYVHKQNLACADDSKQLLNGCCAKTSTNRGKKANTGFPAACIPTVHRSASTGINFDRMTYCTTYHKDDVTKGRAGTKKKDDDQAGGKLVPANIDTYAACDSSAGGSASGSGTTTSAKTSGVDRAVLSVMGIFAIAIARTMH